MSREEKAAYNLGFHHAAMLLGKRIAGLEGERAECLRLMRERQWILDEEDPDDDTFCPTCRYVSGCGCHAPDCAWAKAMGEEAT